LRQSGPIARLLSRRKRGGKALREQGGGKSKKGQVSKGFEIEEGAFKAYDQWSY